jgi:hypothetical protein
MKMTKEHYEILEKAITKVLRGNPDIVQRYLAGDFPRSDRVKDLATRFRWDLLWMSGIKIGDGVGVTGDINGDYNSDHIDTALRRVCPDLNLKTK